MNMEQIDTFYGYFNIVFGTIMLLIGFKIYRPPFKKNREEMIYKKYGNLIKYGGIVFIIYGLIKIS